MAMKMKKLKPGRFVQIRTGEFFRLSSIGDTVILETRMADIAVEHFYNDGLLTIMRQNKAYDIMKICDEAYTRYENAGSGGSKLFFSR